MKGMPGRKGVTKALKFHVSEWDYEPAEVRRNFQNDVRRYISYLVRMYPALNLREVK